VSPLQRKHARVCLDMFVMLSSGSAGWNLGRRAEVPLTHIASLHIALWAWDMKRGSELAVPAPGLEACLLSLIGN